jgi:hypothetical protein
MREAWALVRSSWLTAASYRIGMMLSLIGLATAILHCQCAADDDAADDCA